LFVNVNLAQVSCPWFVADRTGGLMHGAWGKDQGFSVQVSGFSLCVFPP